MYKESSNIVENNTHKNFDFFNTRVISEPIKLNLSTRIVLAITLSIVNIITIPYIIDNGMKTGETLGKSLSQSINKDFSNFK